MDAPTLTQQPFDPEDHDKAAQMAQALGYKQYAYTTTSDLWGYFCLPENPENVRRTRSTLPPYRPGCVIKTRELGLLFVQDAEDLGMEA